MWNVAEETGAWEFGILMPTIVAFLADKCCIQTQTV